MAKKKIEKWKDYANVAKDTYKWIIAEEASTGHDIEMTDYYNYLKNNWGMYDELFDRDGSPTPVVEYILSTAVHINNTVKQAEQELNEEFDRFEEEYGEAISEEGRNYRLNVARERAIMQGAKEAVDARNKNVRENRTRLEAVRDAFVRCGRRISRACSNAAHKISLLPRASAEALSKAAEVVVRAPHSLVNAGLIIAHEGVSALGRIKDAAFDKLNGRLQKNGKLLGITEEDFRALDHSDKSFVVNQLYLEKTKSSLELTKAEIQAKIDATDSWGQKGKYQDDLKKFDQMIEAIDKVQTKDTEGFLRALGESEDTKAFLAKYSRYSDQRLLDKTMKNFVKYCNVYNKEFAKDITSGKIDIDELMATATEYDNMDKAAQKQIDFKEHMDKREEKFNNGKTISAIRGYITKCKDIIDSKFDKHRTVQNNKAAAQFNADEELHKFREQRTAERKEAKAKAAESESEKGDASRVAPTMGM